jgi:hypothetical protein
MFRSKTTIRLGQIVGDSEVISWCRVDKHWEVGLWEVIAIAPDGGQPGSWDGTDRRTADIPLAI